MAETEESYLGKEGEKEEEEEEAEPALNYQRPAEKSISDILKADEDDDSLVRYKQKLLGFAAESTNVIIFPENPNKVILKTLMLKVDSRPDVVISLTGDLSKLKNSPFVIKEGCKYRMQIDFHVQREIVCGLKYFQSVYRKGIKVDSFDHMVGSYAPSKDLISYLTPSEDAPSGMISRGTYTVSSKFVDDDGCEYLKWEWSFEIKKDWKS